MQGLKERYWSLASRMRRERDLLRFRVAHRGRQRRCGVCGWRGSEFMPLADTPDVGCPNCGSQPRHRLLRLVLDERGLPSQGGRILHVSPKGEERQAKWFRSRSSSYLSIDKGGPWNSFEGGGAMRQMDLVDLRLDDGAVDFVCCSHVLENVRDDRKALSEIHRVLAPGGVAALQVQIYDLEHTEEVAEPREDSYWHARRPGRDYFERYERAGFEVELAGREGFDATLNGLPFDIKVPLCRKP